MALFGKKKESKNFKKLSKQDYSESTKHRDVHSTQNFERGEAGTVRKPINENIIAVIIGIVITVLGYIVAYAFMYGLEFFKYMADAEFTGFSFEEFGNRYSDDVASWGLLIFALVAGLLAWAIARQKLLANWKRDHSLSETTDINTYEDDEHIALPEEVRETYDVFPDVGAHSSISPSSMLSHTVIDRKGLKSVNVTERFEEDTVIDGITYFEQEPIFDENGVLVQKKKPLIDYEFGQDLFTSSQIPISEKEIRKPVDTRRISYNPYDDSGKRVNREKLDYDTVDELINDDWELPAYETQRPAGFYSVDTAPVNTMVLAITRAGKGQTYIEPTIDMWTREKRQNNMVINDPKGELTVKFFIPATIRGYEIVQFNLINPLNTDIYNPLGFAAESAREGDFTKAASYIENIGDIFFPKEGADDPMWPNAANNAFKRSAFGLIDYFLEQEKDIRKQAELKGVSEKALVQELDDIWGKVTLYNAYQLFVVLSAKKSSDPDFIKITDDEEVKEKDYLTLFFDATAALPQNEMRKLVQNTDNALRAMAGSDKTIASVYGIALTAMSFFTDPTISTLTSGKPSQNFDAQGLSFPRRIGVRFASEYLDTHKYVGLQSVWEAYSDKSFKEEYKLDDDLFGHSQMIDREGWARYFFEGKFDQKKNYVKLSIRNPKTDLLVKTFYFELELTYKTDLSGRRYVKDPVLDKKIVRDGALRELQYSRQKGTYEYRDSIIQRPYRDLLDYSSGSESDTVDIPVFSQKTVKYTEKPKAVFFITPPHLMSYAKLILILIKQMVDVNFESSYLTKEDQKPLYKTRYMLDEVGNLQSEGQGIPALQTMLSIGLGQDQQFTLILQTLQQLRDVYGESVDRVIQGNTENIIFLKSTDDEMIDQLVKMSGTTHESRVDQKTVTEDLERAVSKKDGKISYTMQTSERPVIRFNDFMFIAERNSIVIKAGASPIWNRRETALPMSFMLFKNQLSIPGREFSLQTIPTNSSAKDFDVRKNQPDFFDMLKRRIRQAKSSDYMQDRYVDAYGISEADLIREDQNVVADEIMQAINKQIKLEDDGVVEEKEDIPDPNKVASDNDAVVKEMAMREQEVENNKIKRYAEGLISREDLMPVSGGGMVNMQLSSEIAEAYAESIDSFKEHEGELRVVNGDLISESGVEFIRSTTGANKKDVETLENAETDSNTNVYGEDEELEDTGYEVKPQFIKYLANLDSWEHIAGGRFDEEVAKAYRKKESD